TTTTTQPTTTSTTTTTTTPPSSSNLVPNPGVELGTSSPSSWFQIEFGPGDATHTWVSGGAHSGNRSVRTEYVNAPGAGSGAAWSFVEVPMGPNQPLLYKGWFKSNTTSEVLVVFTLANGT